MKSKTQRTIRRLFPVLAVVGVLLLAEGLLRLFTEPKWLPITFTVPYELITSGAYEIPSHISEDPDLFWVFYKDDLEAKLHSIAAYEGPNLTVTFGGSIAYGTVRQGYGFPELAMSRAQEAGYEVLGVKVASGGYTTYHSRVLLDRILARGRAPDVAVVCHALNETQSSVMPYREQHLLNQRLDRRVLYQFNRLRLFARYRYWLLTRWSRVSTQVGPGRVCVVPLEQTEENLAYFAGRLGETGAKLALVSQPMALRSMENALEPYWAICRSLADRHDHVYFVDPRQRFRELRRELGLPFADENPGWIDGDLHDPTRQADYADVLFADAAGHQSMEGVKAAGEVLFRFLVENDLLSR